MNLETLRYLVPSNELPFEGLWKLMFDDSKQTFESVATKIQKYVHMYLVLEQLLCSES